MRRRLRRLLAWLRTWSAMESTGRRAWGPDDPVPYELTPAVDEHLSWQQLAWQARFDEVLNADKDDIDDVLARHELDFARRPEEGP